MNDQQVDEFLKKELDHAAGGDVSPDFEERVMQHVYAVGKPVFYRQRVFRHVPLMLAGYLVLWSAIGFGLIQSGVWEVIRTFWRQLPLEWLGVGEVAAGLLIAHFLLSRIVLSLPLVLTRHPWK